MHPLIYHNLNCSTSRNTLAMIEAAGETPAVVDYVEDPPSRDQLCWLLEQMGMSPRELLRRKGAPYDELGLDEPGLSDAQLIDAMLAHPILINRPIVVTDRGVRLCRPSERVLALLDNPGDRFIKEDGEVITYAQDAT